MKQGILIGLAALACASAAAIPAAAGPSHYHTIVSTHGFAEITTQIDECRAATVWVSSSVAMYASQPGPVNKQGLTSVFLQVVDTAPCGAGEVGTSAVDPGGEVLFEADGSNGAALVVDSRLTTASIHTTIAGTDGEGNPVAIAVDATWTGVGPLSHSTVVNHGNEQPLGVFNSTANELRRPATARVTVAVGEYLLSGTAVEEDTELMQTKSRCIEVARPGVDEYWPCFGFPG